MIPPIGEQEVKPLGVGAGTDRHGDMREKRVPAHSMIWRRICESPLVRGATWCRGRE